MPKRVPTVSVIVIREGKRVSPPLNKGFNFTDDEITAINKAQPGALRKPVNETATEDAADVDATALADTTKEKVPASKPKTGKKAKAKAPAEKPADEDGDDSDEDGDDTDADEDEDI